MGFTRAELQAYYDVAVPDLVGDGMRLLFVGINPGLCTAATQTHFAHPGNRFYPALLAAGIIDTLPDLARLWVVPNPSGLNAHDTVATLAAAYAEPARAAGLIP
jgi:G:T/U-mismatch repair DNA glycosylase